MFAPARFRLEILEECTSTQEVLLARRGAPGFHGSSVLARRQTAGYGRRGREWSSQAGNLALSLGLEVREDALLPLVLFACGLALHRTVAPLVPEEADLRLKWPNDLYLNGHKLAGMIAQGRQVPGKGSEVVVGIGVNLARAPEGLNPPATCLAAQAEAPAPEVFAGALLGNLEEVFRDVQSFEELRAEWEKAAHLREGTMQVLGEEEALHPLALLSTGELLVRDDQGAERKLSSEEVSVRFRKA